MDTDERGPGIIIGQGEYETDGDDFGLRLDVLLSLLALCCAGGFAWMLNGWMFG